MSRPNNQIWVTSADLYDKKILLTAITVGIIKKERLKEYASYEEFVYTSDEVSQVLENIFGFYKGNYSQELIEKQRSRFCGIVENQHRYFGIERSDKAWLSSGMCSEEMKQIVKFGDVL